MFVRLNTILLVKSTFAWLIMDERKQPHHDAVNFGNDHNLAMDNLFISMCLFRGPSINGYLPSSKIRVCDIEAMAQSKELICPLKMVDLSIVM